MLRNPDMILTLQTAVGASLWQCQALEDSLIHCLLVGAKFDRNAKMNVVEELFQKYGELTLGQLANQVEHLADVPPELKRRLKDLKKERNWLAHKSYFDTRPHANSSPPTILYGYLDRISKIHDEAIALNELFADILEERVKKSGVTQEYLEKKTQEIYKRWLAG